MRGIGSIIQQNSLSYINLKNYCKIDGTSDDSTDFTTAYQLASTLGMGLYHPGGTLVKGNDTIVSSVPIIGAGPGVSIFKLKNGANTDLFSAQTGSINLSAAAQSGPLGTVGLFSFQNLTLDGNKANQSSGTSYPLRFYAYNFLLSNVEIKNGYTGGILCDWNSSSFPNDGMEATIDNVKIHDNNGVGFQMGGPHDSRLINVLSFNNVSHNFHIAPNAGGTLLCQCHPYHSNTGINAVGYLIEAPSVQFVNCMAEGSDTCQVALIASQCSYIGGLVFGGGSYTGVGIQLGQTAGQTPYPGQIQQSGGLTTSVAANLTNIDTQILNCTNGAINFLNERQNHIKANIYQTSGTVLVSNHFPAANDILFINVTGLTNDHTWNTQGGIQIASSNSSAFVFAKGDGTNIFNLDGNGKLFELVNGAQIYGFSDGFVTQKFFLDGVTGNAQFAGKVQVQNAGSMFSGSGAPSNGNGSNGDYYFRTDTPGTANQRIYVKSAGSWVGIV